MHIRRLAAIDLGTNTVRLLVVEVLGAAEWRPLSQAQTITRLGEGLSASGQLGEAAMRRTIATVADFCAQAEALGAHDVLIVATSAVRDAPNRQAFVDRVHRTVGHRVRVVAGEEEARLALLGTLHGLSALTGSFVLFDIGGGSTEFSLARERRLAGAVSLALGVVPLAERYLTAGPVDWARYAEMEGEIRSRLSTGLADFGRHPRPDHLVGTAGTVTTLAALDQELAAYDPERVQGYVLERHRIDRLLARLGALPMAARAELPCLPPGRADLIIPGTAICLAVMDHFGFASVIVSDFGLREGILIEHLSRVSP
ncbi:MAG: Ppx/GppA family phosphatase [Candidatus Rokubacteria bacterium]|nr:Ppx/GppA family phosphatase [Candidatus Rokubacteria bacterium]